MIKYVCGFAFNREHDYVLLIHKQKPEWQNGKLNGVGGKIKEGEVSSSAMVREFREEVGIKTTTKDWIPLIAITDNKEWIVYFYHATINISKAKQKEIEKPDIIKVSTISKIDNVIPNLKWLIPMALDTDTKIFPKEA